MANNIMIYGARLLFKNFAGVEGRFNSAGKRNFSVLLEKELADELITDGWNVKYLKPMDEYEELQPHLQIAVNFNSRIPPNIVMITSRGKTLLDADTVALLDWAELTNVDLNIRPYNYDINGKTGIKGYVKSLYATIFEDELELKYADTPMSAKEGFMNSYGE